MIDPRLLAFAAEVKLAAFGDSITEGFEGSAPHVPRRVLRARKRRRAERLARRTSRLRRA